MINKEKEIRKLLESDGWVVLEEYLTEEFEKHASSLALDDLNQEEVLKARCLCSVIKDFKNYPKKLLQKDTTVMGTLDIYE